MNYLLLTTHSKLKHGFSLVELLIVISIISLLVAFSTASYQNAQVKSRDGRRKADIKAVQQSLEIYFQQTGRYPDYDGNGNIKCNTTDIGGYIDTTTLLWGNAFKCVIVRTQQPVTFMQQLPKDPIATNSQYFYNPTNYIGISPRGYGIYAQLQNTKDLDIPPQAALPCNPQPAPPRNYCVTNP